MVIGVLGSTMESLSELAPVLSVIGRFGLALVILTAGVILGKGAGRFARAGVRDMKLNGLVSKHHLDAIAGSFVKYLVYMVSIVLALNQIGLALSILNSIVIILLVVIAIGLLLSVKDFIPNVVAGFYIIARKKIKVGQNIKVQDVEGIVKSIELVETKLKTKKGHEVIIPNSFFVKNMIHIKPKKKR